MSTFDSSPSTVSTGDTNAVNRQLDELTKQVIKKIGTSKCSLQKFGQWILNKICEGTRKEINHDWHVVDSFLERAIEHFKLQETDEDNKIHTLAKIKAYLELAKIERDFAQAWTYVNLADSLLPLVVDEKELDACIVRLRARDKQLLKDDGKSLPKDMQTFLEQVSDEKSRDKYEVLWKQEVRALAWNGINRRVSLQTSLWTSVGFYLFLGLAGAIIIAELIHSQTDEFSALLRFPFAAISLLGFFGGGISAFFTAQKEVVDIPNYETIKFYTILRMLLGAAGSFVVFVAANWLCREAIVTLLQENIFAFIGVGIAAGFSEELFVGTLEGMAKNLNITG